MASSSLTAATLGQTLLARGANAFDVAIATALAEGVALPWACGLGGDLFALLYHSESGRFTCIDAAGPAPSRLPFQVVGPSARGSLHLQGGVGVTIPGALDGLLLLHERFATLPLPDLFQPAIDLAAGGIVDTPGQSRRLALGARLLGPRGQQLAQPGVAAKPRVNEALAKTLLAIATGGGDRFYRGDLTSSMVTTLQDHGSAVTTADFARFQARLVEPLRASYRGAMILQTPPPSQGVTLLQTLKILEGYPPARLATITADAIHLTVEAHKLALADRVRHLADPRVVDVPVEDLLSTRQIRAHQEQIRPHQAAPARHLTADGDTTVLSVVDAAGNAAVLVHSLAGVWGSGIVAGDLGFVFNNRGTRGFNPRRDSPIAGARPPHTLHAFMVLDRERPRLIGGTPGGDLGLQWSVQVLCQVLDGGAAPLAAVQTPKWHSFPGADPTHQHLSLELQVEDRVPARLVEALRALGHPVRMIEPWGAASSFQMIEPGRPTEQPRGITDPRDDGAALRA
ncbi:MAG: gamma-glutamyltransferase [Chloroflexota bacterium]